MIKIALFYTGFNANLMSIVETSLKQAMPDKELYFMTYANPCLIDEALENNGITPNIAKLLAKSYLDAIFAGADIIYNVCSTVGAVSEAMKPVFKLFDVPIIRVDEAMMLKAAKENKRIAIFATTDTIMDASYRLLEKCIFETKSTAQITKFVLTEAFGKSPEIIANHIVNAIKPCADQFDVVILTQASLLGITDDLSTTLGLPVYSAAPFGARNVAEIVNKLMD